MLLVPPAVFADVIASRRLPSPAIGLAGSVVLLTVKVPARANPDIARSNSGSAIAVSANRRFRSAMDSPPARHIQAFGKFPPVLTNSGVVFGRLSHYSKLLSIHYVPRVLTNASNDQQLSQSHKHAFRRPNG